MFRFALCQISLYPEWPVSAYYCDGVPGICVMLSIEILLTFFSFVHRKESCGSSNLAENYTAIAFETLERTRRFALFEFECDASAGYK